MDEFTRVAHATSAALRTLSCTESEEEAEQVERVLRAVHLPALGELDPILGAAAHDSMTDMLRNRARRGAIASAAE